MYVTDFITGRHLVRLYDLGSGVFLCSIGYHTSLLDNEQLVYEWRHHRFGSRSCHWGGSREILRCTNYEKSHDQTK